MRLQLEQFSQDVLLGSHAAIFASSGTAVFTAAARILVATES